MALRKPKLDFLNTFERAAFHGSLSRAAQELCISHAAVSRQIRIMEEQLADSASLREFKSYAVSA